MKSKYIITGAVILGAIILCMWLFRSCEKVPKHKDDKKEVDSIGRLLQVAGQRVDKQKDSFIAVIRIKDSAAAAQKKRYQEAVKNQQVEQARANSFAAQVRQAKANNDTANYIEGCDGLTAQNSLLSEANDQITKYADSLQVTLQKAIDSRDSLQKITDVFGMQMRSAAQTAVNKYNSLYTDYTKVASANKWERTKTRIAVATALILGGIIIFKH